MSHAARSTREHSRFEALGTYVHLATSDPAVLTRATTLTRALLAEVDQACSRFRRDSELSRANARAGRWVRVEPLLVAAVRVALEAAEETDGLVDPCLGSQLVWLGYDADLTVVRRRPDGPPGPRRPHPEGAWRDVGLDDGAVRVPAGVSLDLGATAKAWAADLIALTVLTEVGGGLVLSLGGDVRAYGDERVPAWPIAVTEHPGADDATTVWLDGGGLATSSTEVRRWRSGGVERHHLLDPRTAMPVDGPWRTVTATGPTSVAANVAATAALVLGAAAVPWLQDRGVDARLVDQQGRVLRTGRWPAAASGPDSLAGAR